MAQVPAPLAKLGATLRGFTVGQRTVALIGLAVLVLGGFALATFASQPRMSPLYTGLDPADASAIVEQLRADGIPYELGAGGSSVLVPEANVYDARLKAAAAGLPSASQGGYSLLDEMGVTSSEFQQSVTYKRALEGELAGTIQALDGVATASVKLAIPEDTVFVDKATEPTASIFVDTQQGTTLSDDQVQSVVHLVSAAVDGMNPQNVAVVDASGTLLSAVGVGAAGGADQQASDYEQRVAGTVQGMLDRVVGRGNATVAVAADMSLESAQRTEESFTNPDGAPALTESSTTEEYAGSGGAGAGVLGPDNVAVPNTGGEGNYTSEKTDRSNAVNKVTENRTIPSGTLTRQTISVALNQTAAGGLDIAELTTLVGNAAGIDANRGDTVSVSVVPFSTADATAAQEALTAAAAAEEAERRAELVRTLVIAGVGLLAVIAIVIAALLFRRRNRQLREPVDLGELRPVVPAVQTLAAPEPEPLTAALPSIPPSTGYASATHEPELDMGRKRAELNALAASDPSRMADYLRSVMDDRTPV